MEEKKRFYVTTPIFYASGNPHLGHVYTSVACDVIARWKRNTGHDVFFLTGTDEHGQKVAKKATEAGKTPQEFVDEITGKFVDAMKKFNLSHDYFIRTTNPDHEAFVQKMLQKSFDNGDIYKAEYEGLYCVDCERYYKEDELLEGNVCPDHKKPVEHMKEENYFFKLSKYQDQLLKFYEENPSFIAPEARRAEMINRVKEGLQDISISRHKKSLTWGVEFPFDNEHVTYVWFDALYNYISATEFLENKKEFWPCDVHVVGKDISWFHMVYWPAFLMSSGYELPKQVFAHGWWTVDGHKMSKSLGNVIEPMQVADEYGCDELRYYLLCVGTFGEDLNYQRDGFVEKINNDLNNDFGNLVSRVHTLLTKSFDGVVPQMGELQEVDNKLIAQLGMFDKFDGLMSSLKFNQALDVLWSAIRETNAYVNETAPWKEEDKTRLATVMNVLVLAVRMFGEYVDCFMPEKAELLRKQFNFENMGPVNSFGYVEVGHTLGEKQNLFSKVKKEEIKVNTKVEKKSEKKKEDAGKKGEHASKEHKEHKKTEHKKKEKKKVVVFDFDGVLADTFDYNLGLAKKHSKKKEVSHEEFRAHHDGNVFEEPVVEFTEKGGDAFRDEYLERVQTVEAFMNRKDLKKLGNKVDIFIISSSREDGIEKFLKHHNSLDYVKGIYGVNTHASKVKKFDMIFYEEGVSEKDVLFVTDTLGDLKEGNKVGVKSIAVDYGFHETERLKKGNPFKIVSTFKEVIKTIKEEFGLNEVLQEEQQKKKEEKKKEVRQLKFDDLSLKVGKIVSIEAHPDAEKLYVEKIDVGEEEPRQIVSGLKDYYTMDEMLNQKVIVVANLKPAKLRGVMSQGMLLAADDSKDVGLITSDCEVGTPLECDGLVAESKDQIVVEEFFTIKMVSEGSSVKFGDKEVTCGSKSLKALRDVKGGIR